MTEQELQRQRDHEEDLARLRGFRPVDDTFMRVLFRDNLPLAEYVLRIIIGKEDLHLTKEETQKDLVRLVGARGLCLDVHGIDDQNQQYDLEVQRADSGARPERARYHASALDVENLNAGQQFEELPTTYIIFITENDIWGAGKALYPIDRINAATGYAFDDRQHILYVNASYSGDWLKKPDISKLIRKELNLCAKQWKNCVKNLFREELIKVDLTALKALWKL